MKIGNIQGDFSLWTKAYELEFQKTTGIDLAEVPELTEQQQELKELFPHFISDYYRKEDLESIDQLALKNFYMTKPCSLKINDTRDLEQKLKQINELACKHYALAKQTFLSFPFYECLASSYNLTVALINQGFKNAALCWSSDEHHAYIILPFVLNGKEGIILLDPTSDQMWNTKGSTLNRSEKIKKEPRNTITVFFDKKFEYRTKWHEDYSLDGELGPNLFPQAIYGFEMIKDQLVSPSTPHFTSVSLPYIGKAKPEIFLAEAFDNPIEL